MCCLPGDTPLALAARRGKAAVVELLLVRGAVPEPRCERQARQKGHDAVAEALARAARERGCRRDRGELA